MKNNLCTVVMVWIFIDNSCYGMENFSKCIENKKNQGPLVMVESYPIDDYGRVCLGKYATSEDIWGPPAGSMKSDENSLDDCAQRLIVEATNMRAEKLRQYNCTNSFLNLDARKQAILGFSYIVRKMSGELQPSLLEGFESFSWFNKDELPPNIKTLCVPIENAHDHIKSMIADVQEEKAKVWWELKKFNPDIMVTAFLVRDNKLFCAQQKGKTNWQFLMACMRRDDKSLEACAERLVLEQTGMQARNFKQYGTPKVVEKIKFSKQDNLFEYVLVSRDIIGDPESLENTFDAFEWCDRNQLGDKGFNNLPLEDVKISQLFDEVDEFKHFFVGSLVVMINNKNEALFVQRKDSSGVWYLPSTICKNKHKNLADDLREGLVKNLEMNIYNLQFSSVAQGHIGCSSEDIFITFFFTRDFTGEPQLRESSNYSKFAWFSIKNLPPQDSFSGCERDLLYNLLQNTR